MSLHLIYVFFFIHIRSRCLAFSHRLSRTLILAIASVTQFTQSKILLSIFALQIRRHLRRYVCMCDSREEKKLFFFFQIIKCVCAHGRVQWHSYDIIQWMHLRTRWKSESKESNECVCLHVIIEWNLLYMHF